MKTPSSFTTCALILAFGIAAGGIVACQSSPDEPQKPKSPNEELDDKKKAQLEAEIKIGRGMANQLINYFGAYPDEAVSKYVSELGIYIASRSDDPSRYFMFEVLDSDSINAFSAPGGYVFLTRGTILFAENEAELAAVIGHEIAHVEGLHMYKTLENEAEKKKQEKLEKRAKLPNTIRARERITSSGDSAVTSHLSRYLAGGLGMSLMAAVKSGVNLMLKTGLDHKYEYEADNNGVEFAIRAGYNPRAFNNFLSRLREKKKGTDSATLEKTHPNFDLRIQKVTASLTQAGNLNSPGAFGKSRFESIKKRILAKKPGKNLQR